MAALRHRRAALVVLALAACYTGREDPRFEAQPGHASSEARAGAFRPCGTPLAEVDGVWAYSNDGMTGSGESCRGRSATGALEFQCIELAQRYMHETFGVQPLWNVDVAAQMCDRGLHPDDVTPYWLGESPPQRGDLAVWQDGGVGHVAIVSALHDDGLELVMEIVEQDATAEGRRVLTDAEDGWRSEWGSSPDCFVRADVAWEDPPHAGPAEDPCGDVGFYGACTPDGTLVWVEDGECHVAHCPELGRTCGLADKEHGYDCL